MDRWIDPRSSPSVDVYALQQLLEAPAAFFVEREPSETPPAQELDLYLGRAPHETLYMYELRRRLAVSLLAAGKSPETAVALAGCITAKIFYRVRYDEEVEDELRRFLGDVYPAL